MDKSYDSNPLEIQRLCLECNIFFVNPKISHYCNNCILDLDIFSNAILRKGSINTDIDGSFYELNADIIRRPQKNKNQCWYCEKKTGMSNYKCKCGYVFCKKHRLSEKHECVHDFRKEGKIRITRNNPRIRKRKVPKI